jgi:hypothetical protein
MQSTRRGAAMSPGEAATIAVSRFSGYGVPHPRRVALGNLPPPLKGGPKRRRPRVTPIDNEQVCRPSTWYSDKPPLLRCELPQVRACAGAHAIPSLRRATSVHGTECSQQAAQVMRPSCRLGHRYAAALLVSGVKVSWGIQAFSIPHCEGGFAASHSVCLRTLHEGHASSGSAREHPFRSLHSTRHDSVFANFVVFGYRCCGFSGKATEPALRATHAWPPRFSNTY